MTKALSVVAKAQDITERKLRRSNQDLEEFVYVASHDLKEPLHNSVPSPIWYGGASRPTMKPSSITTGASECGEIIFSNNGIGFENTYAEQVFSVFRRLHDKEAYQATGIGLAICRKVAHRHGGEICERRTWKGCPFHSEFADRKNGAAHSSAGLRRRGPRVPGSIDI